MSRPRPHWRAPLIKYPQGAGPGLNPHLLAKRTFFGDFSPESGRRQCSKIRRNGLQCRMAAVNGSERCRRHGGMQNISKRLAAIHPDAQRSHVRSHAFRVYLNESFDKPQDFPDSLAPSFISRMQLGMAYNAFRNRFNNPEAWALQVKKLSNIKPYGAPVVRD